MFCLSYYFLYDSIHNYYYYKEERIRNKIGDNYFTQKKFKPNREVNLIDGK